VIAVKGYVSGNTVIAESSISGYSGQNVIITILDSSVKNETNYNNIDLSKYRGRGAKMFNYDAQDYISKMRADDRF